MMSNSDARKRAAEKAAEDERAGDMVSRLADLIHRAIEPVGAEGAPKCPEDGGGFVGCFAAAGAILESDWLARLIAEAERRAQQAEAVAGHPDDEDCPEHDPILLAERRGAERALRDAAEDVLLDGSAGDYGTHVWLRDRAAQIGEVRP